MDLGLIRIDLAVLAYLVIVAAVIVLVWPGSRAGQAVTSVTSGVSSTLRGG